MKNIILFYILVSIKLQAQFADLTTHNIVKDSFVARFNRNDFTGIYAMGDSNFKTSVSEKEMVDFLQNYAVLGKIQESNLLNQNKDYYTYRLQCLKKSLSLTLGVVNASSFTMFGLDLYRVPANRTRSEFYSDNPLKTSLDSVVQKAVTNYMRNINVSGLSVGIIKSGKMFSYNFGETSKGNKHIPTNNTIYDIGSITKVLTGELLAHAILEEKVKLEDDIRKYLDGFFPNLEYKGIPIKIVNLANHTSRLPSRPTYKGTILSPLDDSFPLKCDTKILNEILTNIVIDTTPGIIIEYSNFAVSLLGVILEKVYNMSYDEMLQKFITRPYKMKSTKCELSKTEKLKYAQGYSIDGRPMPYWTNNFVNPAGGVHSTVSDMLLFMNQQLDIKNKAANLAHQITSGNENKGKALLWGVDRTKIGNYLRWSHDGSTDGFSSLIWVIPGINAGIVLLTNNGDFYDESFNNEIYKTIYPYLLNNQ